MDKFHLIKMAIESLNTVEVHGEQNLDALLTVIRALTTLAILENPPKGAPGSLGGYDTQEQPQEPDKEDVNGEQTD